MKFKNWAIVGATLLGLIAMFSTLRAVSPLYYIPSGSMEPTLMIGDRILANSLAYTRANPKRGDLALLNLPLSLVMPGSGTGTTIFVKRVVAVPGESVEIVNGKLKRNGVVVADPGATWTGGARYDLKIVNGAVYYRNYLGNTPDLWMQNEIVAPNQGAIARAATGVVPPKKYLVLGDNRGNANDSHIWGFADRSTFFARVSRRLWPAPRKF